MQPLAVLLVALLLSFTLGNFILSENDENFDFIMNYVYRYITEQWRTFEVKKKEKKHGFSNTYIWWSKKEARILTRICDVILGIMTKRNMKR